MLVCCTAAVTSGGVASRASRCPTADAVKAVRYANLEAALIRVPAATKSGSLWLVGNQLSSKAAYVGVRHPRFQFTSITPCQAVS